MLQKTERPHLQTAGMTHPGMSGKNNEDRYGLFAYKSGKEAPEPSVFAVVADGVGGKLAGEIASDLAVKVIREKIEAGDITNPVATMMQAIFDASTAIQEEAKSSSEHSGMGTTVTCAWVIGDRLYGANVGNSRLYLLREGTLRQISIDHSWVQEAMDYGAITPEQARTHPNSHIITRYLGSDKMMPDMRLKLTPEESDEAAEKNQGLQLVAGDIVFLCSDGLTDVVEDEEIEKQLTTEPIQAALEKLTALANENGGPDNITSIALQVPPGGFEKQRGEGRRGGAARLAIYLASALILGGLILAAWIVLTLLGG